MGRAWGMRWFRHRIGLGVGLSLMAMALQLVLTLGHTHAGELYGHDRVAAHAQHDADAHGASPSSDHQHPPGTLCPDCLVIAQVATGLTAAPPTLPAQATVRVPLAALRAPLIGPARCCAGFQPRAPPRS